MREIQIATRREFLTRGLGLVGVGAALPNFLIRSALAGPKAESGQRVLVILQLDGGNDTLNTLIPYGHKEYYEYRKAATRIDEKGIIKLDAELGLHPNLAGWKELLDEGLFAVVHGVGYPNPNFSHFESTNIWMMGDTRSKQLAHGWVGRACDVGYPDNLDPKVAVAVGPNNGAALALRGRRHSGILFDRPESFGYGEKGAGDSTVVYRKLNEPGARTASGQLEWVTATAIAANQAADEIRRVGLAYKPKVQYPDSSYGRNLRTVASLIAGGLPTRIYWTGRDGRLEFDTHSSQRPRHDNLLKELDAALVAFFRDLKQQGQAERVLLMTISEFGRTAKENGNKGTDHAAGAAQYLFGPGVKAGFHGKHPSLKPEDLLPTGSALKFSTDFRSIYATVLEKWLGIPSEPVLHQKWPLVGCIA
jgi:uncharacterized protein (DUF1501 family)